MVGAGDAPTPAVGGERADERRGGGRQRDEERRLGPFARTRTHTHSKIYIFSGEV